MRAIALAFSGLLGLATLPGLVQPAHAADRSDRPRFTQASANVTLVRDRDDWHHGGHRYYRGHGWNYGWGHGHHGWNNWYRGGYYGPRFYGGPRYYGVPSYGYAVPYPNYYAAPPVYVRPNPPAYYYGNGGFNLGFNFNFDD